MIGAGFALFAGTLVAGEPLGAVHGRAGREPRFRRPCSRISSSPFRTAGSIRAGSAFIVGAAYLNAIVVQIVMLMFMGIEQVGGCPCPHNLLFVRDDMSVHMRLMSIERTWASRSRRASRSSSSRAGSLASPPLRRALFPILVSGGIAMALLAAMLVASSLPYRALRSGCSLRSGWRLAWCRSPISSGCSGRAWAESESAT